MKIKDLFLCALFFIGSIASNAQQVEIPEVIPPSPDAAALGKYGNIPVGLHTGIPQINIPLYVVKSGSLSLPISISYHASGVKVNEIASWVGLGWSLNAGGVISRSVVGESDEGGFWINSIKKASELTNADYDYLLGKSRGSDGESDYYFYNFNGRSGKFVYGKEDGANKLLLIPKEPIEIEYVDDHFEAIDEVGTKYIFEEIEEIRTYVDDVWTPYNSSYYLTDIYSADDKDNIHLTYTSDGTFTDSSPTFSETIGQNCTGSGPPQAKYQSPVSTGSSSRMIEAVRLSEITFSNGKISFTKAPGRLDAPQGRLGSMQIFEENSNESFSVIKSFVFDNDQYFVSGSGSSEYNYRLKLEGLSEKDENNQSVKNHQFYYNESIALPTRNSLAQDWWGYYNGQTGNSSFIATEDIYYQSFIYHVGDANREPNSTYMKAGILNKIIYPTGGHTEFDYESHQYIGSTKIDKQESVTSAVEGSIPNTTDLLEKMIAFTPTMTGPVKLTTICSDDADGQPYSSVRLKVSGGSTVLYTDYQPPYNSGPEKDEEHWVYLNKNTTYELIVQSKGPSENSELENGGSFAFASIDWKDEVIGSKTAGGLRISEMRSYANASANPIKKIYKYGLDGLGNGTLLIPEEGINSYKNELTTVLTTDQQPYCGVICSANSMQISGNPMYDLTALNGAPVVYDHVTVYDESISAPNGKSVHKFDVVEDIFMGVDKAYKNGRYQTNESWRGGDEKWNASYKGNTTQKVRETTQTYLHGYTESATGTKVGPKTIVTGPCSKVFAEEDIGYYFYYFDYNIKTGISKLGYKSDKIYNTTDPEVFIETEVTYNYGNPDPLHLQLTSQVSKNSEREEVVTSYWYPADYDGNVDNVNALLNQHIIGRPIKTEVTIGGQLVSGTVNRLNSFGKPYEVYKYEANLLQSPPVHQSNVSIPAGYKKRLDINYNGDQKISEVQLEHNVGTVYLWGYANDFPVAKIENATYSEVEAALGTANINLLKGNTLSDQQVRDKILLLRDHTSMANAMVTGFTYDPLYGMTSQTDPGGITTYYEYDDFGRLKLIKDADGNILQQYDYNYK